MRVPMARVLVAPICLTIIACSGRSGGSDPAPIIITNDLSSTGHQVQTAIDKIEAAHPIKIQVELRALEATKDVPVGFAFLSKADVDANKDDILQFDTATAVIGLVAAGKSSHIVEVLIPEELTPVGDYYLICHVDPQESIPETNEDNNLPEATNLKSVLVTVKEDHRAIPDLVLESAEPDLQVTPLDPLDDGNYQERNAIKDQKNHHLGITTLVSTTGTKLLPAVEMQAYLEVSKGQLRPLGIWEGKEAQPLGYLETLTMEDLDFEEPMSLQVCLRLRETLRAEVIQLLGSSQFITLPVHIVIDPKNKIVEYEDSVQLAGRTDDNRITFNMVFTRPGIKAGPGYVDYRKNYYKSWSKKAFGIALDYKTRLHIEKQAYDMEMNAGMPVTIFGATFDFLRLVGDGHGTAPANTPIEPDTIPIDYRLEFAGTTIYRPGYTQLKAKGTLDFWVQKDFPVDSKGRKGYRKTFIVYGVPIEAAAWATGKLGVEAKLTAKKTPGTLEDKSELKLELGPYTSIGVSATGTAKLPFVQPGVGASITLLTEKLIGHTGGTLTITKTLPPKATLDLDYGLTNEVHGPKGRFWVFVKFRRYKWFAKRSWKTVSKTILRWRTFVKRDVLINKQERLDFKL